MEATEKFIDLILDIESGSDPAGGHHREEGDAGGWTQWGLTETWNPSLAAKIRAGTVSRSEAKAHLRGQYLQRYIDGVEHISEALCCLIMDRSVHGHLDEVVRIIQAQLDAQEGISVSIDGILGPQTFGALENSPPSYITMITDMLKVMYPTYLVLWGAKDGYATGFKNRADKVIDFIDKETLT